MKARFLAPALLMLALFGCGGSSDTGGSGTPHPYAGTWTGTWDAPTLSADGTIVVTVSNNGSVVGSLRNNTTSENGIIDGDVDTAGNFIGTAQYPSTSVISLAGTLTLDTTTGVLTGNLTQTIGASTEPLTITVTKGP